LRPIDQAADSGCQPTIAALSPPRDGGASDTFENGQPFSQPFIPPDLLATPPDQAKQSGAPAATDRGGAADADAAIVVQSESENTTDLGAGEEIPFPPESSDMLAALIVPPSLQQNSSLSLSLSRKRRPSEIGEIGDDQRGGIISAGGSAAAPPSSNHKLQQRASVVDHEQRSSAALSALDTEYNGTHFRSRLEARTARLMTLLGVRYVYEPCSFNIGGGHSYTPDFWLPDLKLYIEVKPAYPYVEELQRCEAVARMGFDIALLYGDVGLPWAHLGGAADRSYEHSRNYRGIRWLSGGDRVPGDVLWLWSEAGQRHELAVPNSSSDWRWKTEALISAYRDAQSYKF
jgi:hypothetical protein